MNKLVEFNFNENPVRSILIDGNPFFIARDICLNLDIEDTSKAVSRLDGDEKLTRTLFVSGQNRNVTLINESGLYSLVLTSRKDGAKKFKKWITSEVLPQIRKTGSYSDSAKLPQTFSEALQLAADQARQLEIQAPKVEYFDKVADRTTLLNATQVAQKVGMSAIKMNLRLAELKVYNKLIKRGRVFQQWFIDQELGELKQTEQGYPQAMFTVKGEQWVIQKFVSEGVI